MKKVNRLKWERARGWVATEKRATGRLSNRTARRAARYMNMHPGSVRRKVRVESKRPAPPKRTALRFTKASLALYKEAGSLEALVPLAAERLGIVRSKSTWRRAFRALPAAVRIGLRRGEEAMRDAQAYNTWVAEAPNQVWQADSHEPEIDTAELVAWLALPARQRAAIPRPTFWTFKFIDDYDRFVTGVCTGEGATGGRHVRGTAADATEAHGVPERMRWDGALAHLANETAEALEELGVEDARAVMPYSGWMKGKVERHNETEDDEFWRTQPGWRGGPDSVVLRQHRGRHPDEPDALPAAELGRRYTAWIKQKYNLERPHSRLGGRTPADVREAADFVPEFPTDEALAHARAERGEQRKKGKDGITYGKHVYQHWKLGDIAKGEPVFVTPTRAQDVAKDGTLRPRLNVYYKNVFFCTAKDVDVMSRREQLKVVAHREKQTQVVREADADWRKQKKAAEELRSAPVDGRTDEDLLDEELDSLSDEDLLDEDLDGWEDD